MVRNTASPRAIRSWYVPALSVFGSRLLIPRAGFNELQLHRHRAASLNTELPSALTG
jgi:hypothetical protein